MVFMEQLERLDLVGLVAVELVSKAMPLPHQVPQTLVVVAVALAAMETQMERQALVAPVSSSSFSAERQPMAHFAQVDDQNIVRQVIVVANAAIEDAPFPESEPLGQAMLAESGFQGTYLQCSYNASVRGAYPGQGWSYDPDLDQFIPPSTPEPAA